MKALSEIGLGKALRFGFFILALVPYPPGYFLWLGFFVVALTQLRNILDAPREDDATPAVRFLPLAREWMMRTVVISVCPLAAIYALVRMERLI